MMLFGLLGYGMKKMKLLQAPIILAFILCPTVETNLRRGLMKSQGSFLPFLTSPISCIFLLIAVGTLIWTVRKEYLNSKKVSLKEA